jgi:hypothetical protein
MPEKMGNTLKNSSYVGPLNADPGKADPGPAILNNPLMEPNDKDNYLTDVTKPGGKKMGK